MTRTSFDHIGYNGVNGVNRSEEVCVDYAFNGFWRICTCFFVVASDTCVCDQNVDMAELSTEFLGSLGDRYMVGYICGEHPRLSAGRFTTGGQVCEHLFSTRDQTDNRTAFCQGDG